MLELWFGMFVAEGLLVTLPLGRFRRPFAYVVIAGILFSTGWLAMTLGWAMGTPLALLAFFRLLNLLRIIKNRMHEGYLKRAISGTSLRVFLLHPLLLILFVLPFVFNAKNSLLVLQISQLLASVGILAITARNIRKLAYQEPASFLSDHELPTVTVAIPARNETRDLEECLHTILANDYPKLEILVLDDCSQDKTAEVIRSFAHDGVRFVQGEAPAERWLAKNQAYHKLYKEASGDLILFCGVDVRLGPQAIRCMVNVMQHRNKSMLSVLPTRADSSPAHAFIQPMRYWWQIALPRRLFNRPPVLSTCWMIGRSDLKKLGGFAAVCHAILPEGFFAREMVKTDQYSFVRSSDELEVKTTKSLEQQFTTAVRTRYPQIRRRPEWALILTVVNAVFLILPLIFLISSIWLHDVSALYSGLACLLLVINHVTIVNITDPANSLLAAVTFPLAAFSEVIIGYTSMIQYEFFTIEWKDRNICIPVMHVVPKLPTIPEK